MRRREFIALVGGAAVAWPVTAWAQQTERMRRLGVLMAVAESDADARKGISILQESLQKLGWKDGNNIRIDYRWGNGNPDRIQDLAKELVDLQPDVLGRSLHSFRQGASKADPYRTDCFPHSYRSIGSRFSLKSRASRWKYHRFLVAVVYPARRSELSRSDLVRCCKTGRSDHMIIIRWSGLIPDPSLLKIGLVMDATDLKVFEAVARHGSMN